MEDHEKHRSDEKSGEAEENGGKGQAGNNYQDAKKLIDDEVEKILRSGLSKLPPEVLERLNIMGNIKEQLYDYVNISFVNIFNDYISNAEDEMAKKVSRFIETEEERSKATYSPNSLIELIEKLGDRDGFSTAEMEQSVTSMYSHLQKHIDQGISELELETRSTLEQNDYVGGSVSGESAYSIVKCLFKDDPDRPETVYNVKLSINILESELISPIFHHQVSYEYIIKDIISHLVQDKIEAEINSLREELSDLGEDLPTPQEEIFRKISMVPEHTDDDSEDEGSNRYKYLSKRLLEKLSELPESLTMASLDPLNIGVNIKKLIDWENVKNRGYNTAVNELTEILDRGKLGYQYIENLKNARRLIIKEYEETHSRKLPDERYVIKLTFYDIDQIRLMRDAYNQQSVELNRDVKRLQEVADALYEKGKSLKTITNFEDLYDHIKKDIIKLKRTVNPDFEAEESLRQWDKYSLFSQEDSGFDSEFRPYQHDFEYSREMLNNIKHRFRAVYGQNDRPTERNILEKQVKLLETRFNEFHYQINPHHLQPGLLLDIDIVSIKKIQHTLQGIAGVLNEFLFSVSNGFQDGGEEDILSRKDSIRNRLRNTLSRAR